MKKIVSLLLVLCFCVGLVACGKSSASSASPAAAAATPAATATPAVTASAESAPVSAPEKSDYQALVDELNAEEAAQRTDDDPSVGVFELGKEENSIVYKFAMHIFQYVILMAESGDMENLNAYNRLLDSLPALENSLENALRESHPDLNVLIYLMVDEYSSDVTAVVENGEIIFDRVNGIGTAPSNVTPILEAEELPPEVQEQLDKFKDTLSEAPIE